MIEGAGRKTWGWVLGGLWVFVATACALGLFSHAMTVRDRARIQDWLKAHGSEATATITHVWIPGGEICGTRDLTYRTSAGQTVTVHDLSVWPTAGGVGRRLRVLYDPARPAQVRLVDSSCNGSTTKNSLFFLAASGVAAVVALAGVIWLVRSSRHAVGGTT